MADARPLPVLQAGGFSARVDAYAREPDTDPSARRMRLWFLSLLGPQQSLKALWARLIKGELATMTCEATGQTLFCALAPEGPRAWRSYTASLPAAAGHQLVLLPEAARFHAVADTFVILPRVEDEASLLHFRFLDRRLDLPLHASWRGWLWERALRTGEAVSLEAEGVGAYRCAPKPDALAEELSGAVRSGILPMQNLGATAGDRSKTDDQTSARTPLR